MTIAASVRRMLDAHGIAYELIPHPRTETTLETARVAHVSEDHIAKGVLLKDSRGPLLVVVPGDRHVRLDHLREVLQRSKLELVTETEMGNLLPDCAPGAVPALGAAYGLETWLDDSLLGLAHVYFEAGDHAHLVRVPGEAFRRLLGEARHGAFGH